MSSTVQLLACTEGTPFACSPLAPQQLYTQQLKRQKGLVLLRFESETDAHKASKAKNGRFIRYWIKEIGFLQQWIGSPVFHFTFVSKLDARTSTLV
ncbi:hypothetical protein NC651_021817 [Populus alba x Populus x berolinensis]|nr:hypothetical protein NC651_021817 [Populus alba x Populus x berolinensis]